MRIVHAMSAVLGLSIAAAQLGAQVVTTSYTPNPTVELFSGQTPPTTFVSSMKIKTGMWSVKPVYQLQGENVRVIGLLVTTPTASVNGSNLSAVFYQRPVTSDCDPWVAKTWPGGTPSTAVASLKATYSIPSEMDPLWEIAITSVSVSPIPEEGYVAGFAESDPLGEVVNSSPIRDEVVEFLADMGEQVANMPFESGGPGMSTPWLSNTAQFFDATIGRNLNSSSLSSAIAAGCIGIPPIITSGQCAAICRQLCVWWFCGDGTCNPTTVYGEWEPDGEPCNCTTTGPWAFGCALFTADANGKIKIRIPFPPPIGSQIELYVGIGVQLNMCACIWQRTCVGPAKRTVTTIAADCTRTVTTETLPSKTFVSYGWSFAYPSEQCQLAGRPPTMPPNEQPCGLTNP